MWIMRSIELAWKTMQPKKEQYTAFITPHWLSSAGESARQI